MPTKCLQGFLPETVFRGEELRSRTNEYVPSFVLIPRQFYRPPSDTTTREVQNLSTPAISHASNEIDKMLPDIVLYQTDFIRRFLRGLGLDLAIKPIIMFIAYWQELHNLQ